jgi:two-component system, OmpR family, sensor histidine kinase TrcS
MAPSGSLETGPVPADGMAPHPPGMTLASSTGAGVATDSASARLGGTDKVPSEAPDIDADVLPRLFERFVRADKSRTNGSGNGLGLAIVSSIVKAHHGSVSAESGDGQTVFGVRLPMLENRSPITPSPGAVITRCAGSVMAP